MAWIGGALSLGGALLQSESTEDASNSQDQATAAAINEQRRQYDLNRSDLAPYRRAGGDAVTRLSELLGLGTRPSQRPAFMAGQHSTDVKALLDEYNKAHVRDHGKTLEESLADGTTTGENYNLIMDSLRNQAAQNANPQSAETMDADFGALNKKFTLADFWDDPVTKASYQFGLDEGTKALDRMGGARGMKNSGAQLKALNRYATDYTGQKAAESSNRFYGDQDRTFNRLSGVAGTGQTAATNTAQLGQNTANTVGGMMTAQGNSRGAAQIAGGNAIGGALNSAGNWYNQQRTLNQILNRGGVAGSGIPSNWGGTASDPWYG